MPGFQIISSVNDIKLNDEWKKPLKFTSNNRFVDDNGRKVDPVSYEGRCYQLIEKRERQLSLTEKNLSTKNHVSKRFGVLFEKTRLDPTLKICKDSMFQILSFLNRDELGRCLQVNKKWHVLANEESLWKAQPPPAIAFGKKEWIKYFGDIGEEPPLPRNIQKILRSPCPIWPDKTIEDSNILVLIPETVDGKPLTLNTLGKLVKSPKGGGNAIGYEYIWSDIVNEHGDQPAPKSHWVLMTKDILPGSADKNYSDQKAFVAELAKRTTIHYEVPNVLDAAVGMFMKYVSIKERLFINTYTRCQENTQGYQIAVGGFAPAGLSVSIIDYDDDNVGVAGLRKF